MDQTDLVLCLLLLQNSRTSVRELGDKLGLSAAAVHGRIQALRDAGIIKAFRARIGLGTLGVTSTLVWGASRLASSQDILARLTRDDRVYWVTFAGAGVVYVGAYLRTPSELDACASFIAKEAELTDPVVGLTVMGTGLPEEPALDRLNCRILRSLHRDARKSIADVAGELGLSAKTVGRRLGRMAAEGAAEFSVEWYPDQANDIVSMWHLELKPSADRDKAVALLFNRYGGHLLFAWPLGNLPRLLLAGTWTGSMKDLRDLHRRLAVEEPFARVVPNMLYTGYIFDSWRDSLLLKWAGPSEPKR